MKRALLATVLLAVACRPSRPQAEDGAAPAPVASSAAPAALASAPPPSTATPPPREPCPEGMALVGNRFCIDRWEAITLDDKGEMHSPYHPVKTKAVVAASRPGVVPQGYIAQEQADAACKRAGKRLCTTQQWVDACMGLEKPKRTYPYGIQPIADACNTSRRIHPGSRLHAERRHDSVALNDPQLNQLSDTIAKTGEFDRCVTPEGVFDLHGNLLEWTRGEVPMLMGGHYVDGKQHGPGCTYETDGHGSQYHDFTTGFRCCAKPDPDALAARADAGAPTTPAVAQAPAHAGDSRDPPGMRSFLSATGRLPEPKPPPYEPPDAACPVDMVHVKGERCSEPKQFCKEWLPRVSHGTKIACKEFAKSTCEGYRRPMRYCIDRYEYQPEGYSYPLTHVAWGEAQNLCRAMGKRLCLEDEWEFACEGPDALPYPYGYVRDGKKCNHDFAEIDLVTGPDQFIDRRVARDALPDCVSPFGVFNMVGNVDEWTTRYSAEKPFRSILRGGWWLVGRNRCRAATANHNELYAGVQTGFRCCKESRAKD
jgi:formylglycine-generating enzyme required for sulfatase activity